jgi:hypothetical protein
MMRNIARLAALTAVLSVAACTAGPTDDPDEVSAASESAIDATHACHATLTAEGLLTDAEITSLRAVPQTDAPTAMRLPSRIRGVTFRYLDGSNQTGLIVACNLVGPVFRAAQWAADRGVTDIFHMGGYYNRTVAARAYKSQHAYGRAFDIRGIRKAGRDRWVSRDFAPEPGNDLYDLAGVLAATQVFTVLGPGYDPDHANHLHVELQGCLCEGLQLAPCTVEDTSDRPFCGR